jgi:hypothetical protein
VEADSEAEQLGEAGWYFTELGGTDCTICLAGQFAYLPENGCQDCPAGQYTLLIDPLLPLDNADVAFPDGFVQDRAGRPPYPTQLADPDNGQVVPVLEAGGAIMCLTCDDFQMSTAGQSRCAGCDRPLRCIGGQCENGYGGAGCNACAKSSEPQSSPGLRWYQGGQKCYPCGNTLWIVLGVGLFAASTIIWGLWHITKVHTDDGNMDAGEQAMVEDSIANAQDAQGQS